MQEIKMAYKMNKMSFAALDYDSDSESECESVSMCATAGAPSTPPPRPALPPREMWERTWVLFDDIENDENPCPCCHHMSALGVDGYDDFWVCANTGRRWFIVGEVPDLSQPHDAGMCPGNCKHHPLLIGEMARMNRALFAGGLWADFVDEEIADALALETEAERAVRLAEEARREEMRQLESEAHKRKREAELVESRAKMGLKRGEAPRKAQIPCKKLYSCCGDRATGGAKPTTMHVSSECWAWEYMDPAKYKAAMDSGKTPAQARVAAWTVKHVCPWLHPGEEGWCDEWMSNRNYKPPQSAAAAPAWRQAGGAGPAAHKSRGGGQTHGGRAAAGGGGGGGHHKSSGW